MVIGLFFAILAGFLWGLIFIGPLLIPDYPGILQSVGRYVVFGLISLPFSWYDRNRLRNLLLEDWIEAAKLVFIGNFMYYMCLTHAIQKAGAPISTMIIGTLPVVISIFYNLIYAEHEDKLPINNFLLSLFLILLGLIFINVSECILEFNIVNIQSYFIGVFSAIIAVACWTWYALRNAFWLKTHPDNKPTTWSIAQGIITLPLSIIIYIIICCYLCIINTDFELPLGPRPQVFVPLMITIGLLCSWLGTICWNEASQRLPTFLIGPLIVFETLSGLLYIFLHRQTWPSILTIIGIIFLITGIVNVTNIKKIVKKNINK